MRAAIEIDAEIALLESYLPRVCPTTAFGYSNTDVIRAEIRVLRERCTEVDVWDLFPDDEEGRLRMAAEDAQAWMLGESEEKPSEGWKPLLKG